MLAIVGYTHRNKTKRRARVEPLTRLTITSSAGNVSKNYISNKHFIGALDINP